jgi:hypothetical protein
VTPAGTASRENGVVRVYIRLAEALGPTYARAFDDLTIHTETVLTGELPDDAALHGLLARLRDLDIGMLDLRVEGRASQGPISSQ